MLERLLAGDCDKRTQIRVVALDPRQRGLGQFDGRDAAGTQRRARFPDIHSPSRSGCSSVSGSISAVKAFISGRNFSSIAASGAVSLSNSLSGNSSPLAFARPIQFLICAPLSI